jgi:hypothetical protein
LIGKVKDKGVMGMHFHKYEKIWLVFGVGSLALFLTILGFGAFWKGTHPQSTGRPLIQKILKHMKRLNKKISA